MNLLPSYSVFLRIQIDSIIKKWIYFFCVMLVVSSCNSLIKSKPASIISEEKMTTILIDLHLTEAIVRIGNDSVARSEDSTQLRIRYAEVFRKHGIKPDQFTTSLNYYLEHIDELDKIYSDVIGRLSEMEAKLTPKIADAGISSKNKAIQDSISYSNPWFWTVKKNSKTNVFQYFDTSKYPFPSQIQFLIKQ